METDFFAKKLANLIGTSTIVAIGGLNYFASGVTVLPNSTYVYPSTFTNPFEFKVSLQNEEDLMHPNDTVIPIPEVQKMVFNFSAPIISKFTI